MPDRAANRDFFHAPLHGNSDNACSIQARNHKMQVLTPFTKTVICLSARSHCTAARQAGWFAGV